MSLSIDGDSTVVSTDPFVSEQESAMPKDSTVQTVDVWGKELKKDELQAAHKASTTAKNEFNNLQVRLDNLYQAWEQEKSKGGEADLQRMILIAHYVASISYHLGGRQYKQGMNKSDDEMAELVKKLQTTYDNPWGKGLTVIAVGVSLMGAVCSLPGAVDGVFRGAAAVTGSNFAGLSVPAMTQMSNAAQPMGTLGTSVSSAVQITEKPLEQQRQKHQHDQGVAQRTREEQSQARSKAQELAKEAARNVAEMDAAKHRAMEQQ